MEAVNSFLPLEKKSLIFLFSLHTFFFDINHSHTYTVKNLGH